MPELNQSRVIELFSLFSDLETPELDRWHGFCNAAATRIAARVREDVNPALHMDTLCAAAAGLAYSDYLSVQTASGLSDEIRVGDISLRSSSSSSQGGSAAEIREHFLREAAHLLKPDFPALTAVGLPS